MRLFGLKLLLPFAAAAMATSAVAEEAIYRFGWTGAGGYRLQGAMAFDGKNAGPVVRETDLTCFEIAGFKDDAPLGRWDLSMLAPDTSWRLHFFAPESRFLVEGEFTWMPQAWNMRGDGSGCGPGGFGFNLGNIAQDICVDDQVVLESQADPFQPFPAAQDPDYQFTQGACHGPLLLGALPPARIP